MGGRYPGGQGIAAGIIEGVLGNVSAFVLQVKIMNTKLGSTNRTKG